MFLSMFSSKNINFFLLFIFLLHLPIQPLDLYVSNFSQTPGYGSEASPFISITSVLNATYSDSILNVYLLSNQKPYIIDIAINIQKDLKIVYQNGGNHAIIDFVGIGSIEVTGEYSVIFEGVSIRRSIVDSANFAINLIGLSLLNLTNCVITENLSNVTLISINSSTTVFFLNTSISNLNITTKLIQMLTIKQITIDSCNFTNSLLNDGYYLYSTLSNFNIKNCNFINNTINQANIGQIYSLIRMGSSVNISNTVFMSNYLVNTTLISINNDNTVEEKIVIISNKVLILYNTQILEMALAFMIVGKNLKVFIQDNVTFQYNFAHSSFLYISDTLSCLLIEDMFLINNFGFEMVSLQLLSNITITRMHCENNNDFSYNYYRINNIINTPGNCLSIVNYVNLYLQNSIFSKNFAESTLTGILLEHTPNLDLLGVQTNQTKAYFEKIVCNENVVNATLDNLITNGNCFLLINSGTTTIINCVISYNINNVNLDVEYSGNPCLISLSNDNNLHIIDSIFVGNQAYSECSCLNFQGTNFLLKNVSFIENRSIKMQIGNDPPMFYVDNEGGCMNLGAENITMNDVRIYNSSALKGAGIFFHNKNSKKFQYLDVFNMSIIKNEGIQTSGIEFDASLIVGEYVFTNCVINENYVEFYGVISTFYFTGFNIYFYNSDISFNWGITAGAAFSFYHFTGEFFINQSTLIGNVLNQSVFVGGAALFLYGATRNTVVYVTATKFINNTSSLKGGAIQSMYGNVIVRDSEFIDNSALYGGAISIAIYCPSSFINVIVRSSKRSIQGGAFHFREHAYIFLKNISIYDCQADQGGGIYIDGFQMSFIYSDLSFYNVKAVDGAAIWILNSFSGLTFITNVYIQDSETSSSLINIDSLEMVLTNLILVRNKGRAIFINNSTFTLAGGFVSEHFCQGVDNQGCFAYIQEISVTFFSDLYFQNVFSEFIEDTFSIINTDITFTNISFRNCTTEADTILVTAFDCKIFLQDSTIKDLNNALIKITSTELIISNSLFMNISSQSSFAIIEIIDGLNFLAHSSSFLFISGKFGGAISLTGGAIEYDYNLTNVLIKDCTAWKGAGVYINGQNFNIINSSFINNTALNGGGGLYFDCSLDDNYKWVIESSNFINNTAKQGGAFHSTRYIPIYNNKCFFINNTAQYGNDFSGTPLQMTLEVENNLLNCDLNASNCYLRNNAITSGQTMPPLIISILDYYGQKMTLLNGLGFLDLITQPIEIPTTIEKTFDFLNISENSALIRNTAVFTGVKTQILLNGSFNFSEVVIQSKPPSNVWIKVKSDLIPIYFSDLIPNNSYFNWKDNNTGEYYFLFKMYIRECISGEVSFNNGTECNVCPKGKYSFFATDLDCKTCPITAECDGGNLFSLNKGFWRPYNNSDDVYTCNLLTESCLGGVNSECSNGYSGIMCSSCLFNEKQKYFKKAVFFCEECTNVWIYILIIVIVSFFIFGFIVFLITRKGANIENYVLIKIITNHIQTISFLSNVKIEFPKFLQGFINAQAPITSMDSFVFTIDCFKDSLSLSIYEMKLILSIVIMFGVVFVVILGFILIGYRKKQRKMNIIFNIINALVIIFSFFQPPFINFYIQNLSCDTVNNQQYMTYNLEQECWNKSHLTYSLIITIPFLLFWMVFFPLIFLIYMRKHRNNLDDTIVKQITIYFQAGYEKRVYYWEFVQMIRKFSVILLITFLRNNPQSVIYILIPVIAFFFILQIEILSLNACFITYYSAAFYFKVISKALKTFFLIVILTANGVFFFFWIQKYLLVLKGRIKNILTNFRYSKNGKSLFSSKIRPLTRKRTFTDPKKMSK